MSRLFTLVGSVALALTAAAHENHSQHCLYGCPSGAPASNDVVVRSIYILSSNDRTKFADWVAYRVDADNSGPTERGRNFQPDPLLAPSETLEDADYTGAFGAHSYHKGHYAPTVRLSKQFRGWSVKDM